MCAFEIFQFVRRPNARNLSTRFATGTQKMKTRVSSREAYATLVSARYVPQTLFFPKKSSGTRAREFPQAIPRDVLRFYVLDDLRHRCEIRIRSVDQLLGFEPLGVSQARQTAPVLFGSLCAVAPSSN